MEFIPVNELERRLVAAATSPEERPAFYRAVAEQELFVISEGRNPETATRSVLPEGTKLQVKMLEIEGKTHVPIFSAVERISLVVKEEVGFMAVKGRELLPLFRGSHLILNPGSPYGKLFTPAEVDFILDGSAPGFHEKKDVGGKKILLGQPKEYPQELVDVLCRYFVKNRSITAAYLAHSSVEGEEPSTLIGVETTGEWEPITRDVGPVISQTVKPGTFVDLVPLKPGGQDVIGEYMRKQTKPFYRRKKWLGLF